jgi:hypothetical protein
MAAVGEEWLVGLFETDIANPAREAQQEGSF